MGTCAARLAAVALAAIALAAAGCRRAPVAGRSGDASDTGDSSTTDAPADQPGGGDGPADLASADLPSDVGAADASTDAPDDAPNADAPVEVGRSDAPTSDDAPSDRTLADSSDVRPEDQPCGPQGFICAPFACDVARGVCKSICATNDDCATGQPCSSAIGLCGFRQPATCISNDECRSGFCAQGVCCATSCTGSCRSCAVSGSIGTCVPVPRGAPDPIGICGAGATCNGRGGCVPATCVADTDCGDLYWCTAGRCAPCGATCVS